jgi:DNA transposition AAA+ family ATPase
MTVTVNSAQAKPATPSWDRPVTGPKQAGNRSEDDIILWHALIDRLMPVVSGNGWTKSEVARRIGMPDTTFSLWFSGKYEGRLDSTNRLVEQWLDAIEEQSGLAAMVPSAPAFLHTIVAAEIMQTLAYAQIAACMVMITIAAGNGKTTACRHFRNTRPHVYLMTVSPHTRTAHATLIDLAEALGVRENNPAKLTRAIGERLQRIGSGTLLIIDEAQNLSDDAINQLRHFTDVYECGLALVGNNEIYKRLRDNPSVPSNDQLKRRIAKRLQRNKPRREDVATYIAAWGIVEEDSVRLLTGIGMKGGALGQICETMKLATMIAVGAGEPVSRGHIEAAWKNRDVEDLG